MRDIHYIDRITKKEEKEEIYGKIFLNLLYGHKWYEKLISFLILHFSVKLPFISVIYGLYQKSRRSKKKIIPFIKKYSIDASEFLNPVESFQSFNEFFIRRLKPEARPLATGNDVAVLPADARYLFFPNIATGDGFLVKGKKFNLLTLLKDQTLVDKYAEGAMVIARLCPTDYHRFHFVSNGIPEASQLINGHLYSVNPMALKRNIEILAENKRMITPIQTKNFGTILYIEVGATNVGTIHQTYIPCEHYAKGDEKGYFSFGGSTLIILFEPSKIQFDQDLLDASHRYMEIRGLFGQSMGRALSSF